MGNYYFPMSCHWSPYREKFGGKLATVSPLLETATFRTKRWWRLLYSMKCTKICSNASWTVPLLISLRRGVRWRSCWIYNKNTPNCDPDEDLGLIR